MKTAKFLQQAKSIADYFIQTVPEIGAAPQQSPSSFHPVPSVSVSAWDGVERRATYERRENERRNERLSAMLDTRVGWDRRRISRRMSDELELRSFSCRV